MEARILEVVNASVALGNKKLIEQLSFSLQPGDFCWLVGPNGAGKSSLLKALVRIIPFSNGEVRIAQQQLGSFAQSVLANKVGYMPQLIEVNLPMSVTEFIEVSLFALRGGPDDRLAAGVKQALKMAQIDSNALMPSLSGGERQRVLLAATLALGSEILLLDEPTCHLDPKYVGEAVKMVSKAVKDRRAAVLFATHDLSLLRLYPDAKVLACKDGAQFYFGELQEFMSSQKLKQLFEVDFSSSFEPIYT